MKSLKYKILALNLIFMFCLAACGNKENATNEIKSNESTDIAPIVDSTKEVEESEVTTTSADNSEEIQKEEKNEPKEEFSLENIESFELTSTSINDGVWDSKITNTENGSNVSPQLSWEPVEGANCYIIYMIDTSATNWMHWKSGPVTETNLDEGWADEESYIGPYPPDGTHTYDIYVFAVKEAPETIEGSFDKGNPLWSKFIANLANVDDNSGNIIAYGYISGTYTTGD